MAQNNFIMDVIGGLKKPQSKKQIKADIKDIESQGIKIKLIGVLDKVKTRAQLKKDVKALNATVNLTGKANSKQFVKSVQQATAQAQKVANSNKVKIPYSFETDKKKLQNQLKNFAKENSRLFSSKEMTAKYNQLVDSASIAKSKQELKGLRNELSAFKTQLIAVNKSGMTWIDKFKASIRHFAEYFSGASFIYAITNQFRNAWTEAKTLDDRLVDLQKVTSEIENRNSLYKYFDKALNKANELNVKVDSLIYAITEFKKLGWSLPDAELGGQWATMLSNVGDVDIDTAIGSIKTAIASFDEIGGYGNDQMDKKLEAYVDLINNMSNKYSIDAQGLAEAIRLSAGTLTEANTSIEQAATMFATANKYYNDPEYLANTAKIGSLRMRATTGDDSALKELSEMGEDIEDVTILTGKLREELLSLTGVDIMIDNTTFKSYYQQLEEISRVIDTLDDTSSAKVLEMMYGKNRAAAGYSLLSGMQENEKAYIDAINSAGSATAEYETWMQSADAATQRFSNSLTEMYQSILNGNTVRDLADMGSVVVDFANSWGIVEGAVKGYLALKIGTLITNGGMAFIAATKQVEQYGKALQMANNVPNGNLAQRYKNLRSIAEATNSLTSEQLKHVLSSKQLSYQDRIRILQMQNMSKEMAVQKLKEMQLTQATNVQTTATNAQTVSTFNLKAAMTGLGKTIHSVFLSNPVGITLMAVSVGISAIASAISNYKQNLEDTRQANMDAATSAKEEADALNDLYIQYKNLSGITNRTSQQEDDFKQVVQDITKALGDKAEVLRGLTEDTDKYAESLEKATKAELAEQYATAKVGAKAAEEALKDVTYGSWGGSQISISLNEQMSGDDEHMAALETVRDVLSEYEDLGQHGLEWEPIGWDENRSDMNKVVEYYNALLDARTRLVTADNADFLMSSDIYEQINATINKLSGSVDKYTQQQYNALKLNYEWQNGIPSTTEEFQKMETSILEASGAGEKFKSVIKSYLSTDFSTLANPVETIKETVEEVVKVANNTDFSNAWSSLQLSQDDATKDLATDLLEIAEAGELTAEKLLELDSTNYFENLGISASEATNKINDLVDASTQLSSLGDNVSKMSDMLATRKDGGMIDASELAGFDADVRGLETWEEFERVMGSSKSTMEECQKAANALATEWVNDGNFLANLTEKSKDYYITQLDRMGVLNSREIVEAKLAQIAHEEALALDYNTAATKYNSDEKNRNNQITAEFTDITNGEIEALLNEQVITADTANALAILAVQKEIASGTTLDTSADIENLVALAGATTKLGALLNKLAEIKKGYTNGMPSYVAEQQAEQLQKEIEAMLGGGNKTALSVPVQVKPTGSSSYKSPTAKKEKEEKQEEQFEKQYDWIETLLEKLSKVTEKWQKASEKFFSWWKANAVIDKAIKANRNEINANEDASEYYRKKANKVGLSKKYRDLVENGAIKIQDIKDEGLANKIDEYQKWYDNKCHVA